MTKEEANWKWLEPLLAGGDFDLLMEVRRKIEVALSNNVLPNFTDHSITHCDRVIEILQKMVSGNLAVKNDKTLRQDELLILALAVLLHDVGMQLPKAHGIETSVTQLTLGEHAQIRRDHGEISGDVIRRMLDGDDSVLHLGLTQHGIKQRLPFVATLCENHQSAAKYDPAEVGKLTRGKVRVGLLVGLLRLADELDCDSRRVDLDRLDQFAVPLESVFNWLVCSYVDAVSIEGGLIEISASFPDTMTGPEIDYVASLLIGKLRSEYKIAKSVLWQNGIPIEIPENIVQTKTDFTHRKRPLPQEVLGQVEGRLSSGAPTHVVVAPPKDGKGKEVDWMTHWGVVGNPFLDRPVAYGMDKFVETLALQERLAEVGSFLRGSEGELKLVIAPRGMGKTTLFESISAKYRDKYDIFIINVAEQVSAVRTVADLKAMIFFSIHKNISQAEPSDATDRLVEAARLGNKKVICVDSLDRLPEDKEPIVRDFFKTAQHTLSSLRAVSVVLFACGETWGRFLSSDELSYLGYRNQWELAPFTPDDIREMLDRRLKACGKSYDGIFESGCTAVLHTQSGGNPRKVLEQSEAICRLAAQKKLNKVSPRFIREEYQLDFDQAIEKLLTRLANSSKECGKALTSIYHYYLEMERRGLSTSEGWNYLVELVETGLPQNRVPASYWTPLRHVSGGSSSSQGNAMLTPHPFLKPFFKELKKEGYSVRDFIAFYSTNPVAPGGKDDDLEVRIKSPLVLGPDVEYFEKARQLFISTKRSTAAAFQVISDSWDCVENMIYAILLKNDVPELRKLMARRDEWLAPDKFGVLRHIRGAGKLRADYAYELTELLKAWRRRKGLWMPSWVSLNWLRDERANVVRGRTEHLAQYGEREREICLRHLDVVYRELSRVYG